jgi:hypothetical protein
VEDETVSNAEGDKPDFDDLDLSGEEMLEPADEVPGAEAAEEVTESIEEGGLEELGPAISAEPISGLEEPPEEEAEEEPKEKKPGLFARLAKASPYVVLLGISLAAILICIFCLLMEWKRYDFQTKPTQARTAPAVQSGAANTSATA